jgi:hypothetical protein
MEWVPPEPSPDYKLVYKAMTSEVYAGAPTPSAILKTPPK